MLSRAFRAEIDSAKRQLIGILGLPLPTNLTSLAYFSTSNGKSLAMRGFAMIPVLKTLSASAGTLYDEEADEVAIGSEWLLVGSTGGISPAGSLERKDAIVDGSRDIGAVDIDFELLS